MAKASTPKNKGKDSSKSATAKQAANAKSKAATKPAVTKKAPVKAAAPKSPSAKAPAAKASTAKAGATKKAATAKPAAKKAPAKPLDLKGIADMVVALNSAGNHQGVLALYSSRVVSVEAYPAPDGSHEARGIDGIKGKWAWWESAHEIHSAKARGPFLHGADRFAIIYDMDVTDKQTGKREKMQEVALYTVSRGKIVREEFFY